MPSNPLDLDRDLGAAVHQGLPVPHLQEIIRKKGISLQAESEKLLLLAAYTSRKDVLQWLLLEAGVALSPYVSDDCGSTILDIAVSNEDDALVHWIMGTEKVDTFRMLTLRNGFRLTPLEVAIKSKNKKVIWALINDIDLIPWNSKLFRKVWLRLLESAAGETEVLDILQLPWREYQLRDIWRSYESQRALGRDSLEAKLLSCDWWPLFADESVWNDRERSYLEGAMRRGAAKGHVEIVKWLAEDWAIDFAVVNLAARDDLSGFLTLPDCAVHGAVTWKRDAGGAAQAGASCTWGMAMAINEWDGMDSTGLLTKVQTTIAHLYENGIDPEEGVENEKTIVELQNELKLLREESNAERGAVLNFLLDTFGSGAMPRLDLVVIAGRVSVLELLRKGGWLDLSKQIVIHAEQTSDVPDQLEECAVCFGELRSSITFPCKHRFCTACHFDLRVSRKKGEAPLCPLCRAPVPAWSEDLEALVVKHLRSTCEWLVPLLEPGMTRGDVLSALAVQRGMLRVVEWLHASGVALSTRYGGRNLMHVAAASGHFKIVKWLCCNGMKRLAAEQCGGGRRPIHDAALAGDRSTVLYLMGEGMMGNDAEGRSLRWYCRQSPSKELRRDARAWARLQYLSSEIPRMLAAGAPLEELARMLAAAGVAEDTEQMADRMEKTKLCRFLWEVCKSGRADVLRWVYAHAGLEWVHGVENPRSVAQPQGSPGAAPSFAAADARAASGNTAAVMAVMAEVAAAKEAGVRCEALCAAFETRFAAGAAVQELLRLAAEQAAVLAAVPPDLRHYFGAQAVALSACSEARIGELLGQAAALGHAHLADWMLLEPRIEVEDAAVGRALRAAVAEGRLATSQLLLEELLRRGIDVNRLPQTENGEAAAAAAHWQGAELEAASVAGLAIRAVVRAAEGEERARRVEVLRWVVGCAEVELAGGGGGTALEELASAVQVVQSSESRGAEREGGQRERGARGMGHRPRRKKKVAEEALQQHGEPSPGDGGGGHVGGHVGGQADVLEILLEAGLDCRAQSQRSHAVKTLAECGRMELVRRLAVGEGVNIQGVRPFWDMLLLWFDSARAAALVEAWGRIQGEQETRFELADDILRGAGGIEPQRLHGVSLQRLRDRQGRTVLDGARADGCRPAVDWLAAQGVTDSGEATRELARR